MNELTPERLAAIKDRIADYPEANMPNDDLPLLVAEVERLTAEFNRQAAIGELLDADAENKIDRLQSALSAAEKRIQRDREFICHIANLETHDDMQKCSCPSCRARRYIQGVMVKAAWVEMIANPPTPP